MNNKNVINHYPLIHSVRNKINISEQISDDEFYSFIEDICFSMDEYYFLSTEERLNLIEKAFYTLRYEFGILQPLLSDNTISEIMINGKDNIFIEKNGRILKNNLSFDSVEQLEDIIRKMTAKVRREINELNPIVDARLLDGSRINAVHKNIAIDGPVLTIRKFPEKPLTMDSLIEFGTITEECAEYLKVLVLAGYNIFISGGTSSGKTTFLNVLSNFIPKEERVIIIEDSAELQIKQIDNLVRLECRNANLQGKGRIVMQDLIKSSLRMRPDRIIVGEVRGAEVFDMVQAMNTGHDGSLCTGHGNSIPGILKRLEAMLLQVSAFPIDAIRNQLAEGIDIIVQMGRLPDKRRVVLEIAEISKDIGVNGIEINTLFKYELNKGLIRTEKKLVNRYKLMLRGYELT